MRLCFRAEKFSGVAWTTKASPYLHPEAIKRHPQEILALRAIESAARYFQVAHNIAIIREHVAAILRPRVNLQGVVVPIKVRRRDFDP